MSFRFALGIVLALTICGTAHAQVECFGIPATSPDVCSGHGDCIAQDTCACDVGWGGLQCESPVICFSLPSNNPDVCSGHGDCIAADTCQCDAGWTGPDCSTPLPEIPTLSMWGLTILMLALLTAATVVTIRRPGVAPRGLQR